MNNVGYRKSELITDFRRLIQKIKNNGRRKISKILPRKVENKRASKLYNLVNFKISDL